MPESIINIRLASIEDAHAIATIHVLSWQKIYQGHIPDSVLDQLSIKEREQQWAHLISNNIKILKLEKNNEIVGFASLCASRDADTNPTICGEISAIYLHPNVWHQGLGKQLCHRALIELKNMGFAEVILWVLKENTQARKFYENMGFTATGDTKLDEYDKNVMLNEVRYRKILTDTFSFKPLQEKDLDLLCQWLDKPHVKNWWNDHLTPDEIKAKYSQRIGDKVIVPFIAYLNNKPIGFIQYYLANKVGEGWRADETEGTVGIDQFIGEENFIDRGYGTQMIRTFIQQLFFNPNIKKIITDVDPNNQRAIRCYEKVGFKWIKEVNTPTGPAYLLSITP